MRRKNKAIKSVLKITEIERSGGSWNILFSFYERGRKERLLFEDTIFGSFVYDPVSAFKYLLGHAGSRAAREVFDSINEEGTYVDITVKRNGAGSITLVWEHFGYPGNVRVPKNIRREFSLKTRNFISELRRAYTSFLNSGGFVEEYRGM